TWGVSDNDISAVDGTGLFNVYVPVAAPVQVNAYAGAWQASGVANVVVNVNRTDQAPVGSPAAFMGTPSGTDSFVILYPYANTVFPRALAAPKIQWDNQGTAASAVKISLRYPATGTPTFTWSTIIPESSPPRATIPQDIWTAFDQTAKGK